MIDLEPMFLTDPVFPYKDLVSNSYFFPFQVTPGSVAADNLTPGDVILKIGNVNATNITHMDAQEVIKGACNILQLTIKKYVFYTFLNK